MHYVYLLRSIPDPTKTYVGYTTDLRHRFRIHNSGGSRYTARHRPRRLVTYVAFSSKPNALDFERYLKSHSGMAFASKRLW